MGQWKATDRREKKTSELYPEMTFTATGFTTPKSAESGTKGREHLGILIGMKWWSLEIPTGQTMTMLNTMVRARYRYGLMNTRTRTEVAKYDERWKGALLKAIITTRAGIKETVGDNLRTILQVEKIELLVEREAGREVRRWKEKATDED